MMGEVIAHFIIPATYNTREAIEGWIKRNVDLPPSCILTWETVGTIGDRALIKGEGYQHVYIIQTENHQPSSLGYASGEYME